MIQYRQYDFGSHKAIISTKIITNYKENCNAVNLLPKRSGTIVTKPLADLNVDITVIITQLRHFKTKQI